MNRALIMADEVDDDGKPSLRIRAQKGKKNVGRYINVFFYLRFFRFLLGLVFRFSGVLLQTAERRVGKERNYPILLPLPVGAQKAQERGPARVFRQPAVGDDRLQL